MLQALHDERVITFDTGAGRWESDLAQVRTFALSNDAVSFMVRQLQKLPSPAQDLLTLAACLGSRFDLETLALAAERPTAQLIVDFWPALEAGLVMPLRERYHFSASISMTPPLVEAENVTVYRFMHDQVQQAAVSLVPEVERQSIHLHIGRRLREHYPMSQAAQLFAIVHHLNQGSALLADQIERDDLARLNLQAGREARAITAFTVAYEFFTTGLNLLGAQGWQRDYEMALRFDSD